MGLRAKIRDCTPLKSEPFPIYANMACGLLNFTGFAIDIMACLPYDALNVFDNNVKNSSYGNIFSILKVYLFPHE